MPCVLPVLGVKLVGLAALGGQDARTAHRAALGYVLGVVGSLCALGVLVSVLAELGRAVGWGFQLQEPAAVAVLLATVVAFALHLFGVWRVGVPAPGDLPGPQGPPGLWRSAGEGLLAVVLATPCSAPFLGTAVGFALGAGPGTILLVFATLGVGLAAPFALAATLPAVRRRLPRPGAWMHTLETGLGFALLATGIWLSWVLVQLAGPAGLVRGLSLALATAAVAVVIGRSARRGARRPAVLALVGAAFGLLRFAPPPPALSAAPGDAAWQPWSPGAVATAR
ncbi:MAG: thiol:disulfide interchange protein, partial [Myxococcota bacterium]